MELLSLTDRLAGFLVRLGLAIGSGLAFRFAAALLAVDFVRAIRELLASCAPLARPALLLMALRMTHA